MIEETSLDAVGSQMISDGLGQLLDAPPHQAVLMLQVFLPEAPARADNQQALRRLAEALWRYLQFTLVITLQLGAAQDSFVIFDLGDDTYHAGDGNWTDDPDKAQRYESEEAAQGEVDRMNCTANLRNRLVIRSADLA